MSSGHSRCQKVASSSACTALGPATPSRAASTGGTSPPLTTLVRDFESKVQAVQTSGERTLLWDAVAEATQQLLAYRTRHAGCALRVLVLTDGKDEGSAAPPAEVLREVQARGVLLDSIVVGAVPDFTLDAAAEMSGGSCHRPGSWAEAQALFEADAMVCFSSPQP